MRTSGKQIGLSQSELIDPLFDFIFEHPLLHPADGEQIVERREQAIPNSVMALAGEARIVRDFDFGDGVAFDLEQRRQKAVHSLEKLQVLDALALERAISAACVGNFLSGKLVANPVRDAR